MRTRKIDQTRPAAIVIGLDSVQGLQAARILASHSVPVIAIAKDPRHYACRSRAVDALVIGDTEGEGLIAALEQISRRLTRKAVLFPCEDNSVLVVSRYRDSLAEAFRFVLPAADVTEMLMDKMRFHQYARENGFAVPETFIIRNHSELAVAAQKLPFPGILKPPIKTPAWNRHTTLKAFQVHTPEELMEIYEAFHALAPFLILQKWVEGDDSHHFTCNAYFDANSEPLVTFVSQKIRQWPPRTGQGCLGVECRNDWVLQETVRFFRSAGFRGLAYLDMKKDARTGQYYLIEPNIGRPTGRSATAEAGGVPLLYTMYCDALGLPLPPNRRQTYTGVKWIHLRRDLQAALHHWRQGELTPGEWRHSVRGKKTFALFSWRDPLPFLLDLTRGVRLYLSPAERQKRNYQQPIAPPSGASSPHRPLLCAVQKRHDSPHPPELETSIPPQKK